MLPDPIDSVIKWWDELANLARGFRSAALLEIGRAGERNTIAFETQRTGKAPYWQSIESSHAGFDVLSSKSSTDPAPLAIEVKASELRLKEAWFSVTVHEWETARQSPNYCFHLWRLGLQPQLAVLSTADVAPHLPADQGRGQWQSARVPFSAFIGTFQLITLPSVSS